MLSDYRNKSCIIHLTAVIEQLRDMAALRNAGAPLIQQLGGLKKKRTTTLLKHDYNHRYFITKLLIEGRNSPLKQTKIVRSELV